MLYASRAARRLEASQWAFFAVIGVAAAAVTIGHSPGWPAAIGFVLAFVGTTSLLRAVRLSLELSGDGVEVRNLWWTSRVRWDEMDAIGWADTPVIASQYSSIWRPAVAFRRKSGRILTAEATFALTPDKRRAVVADLVDHARRNSIPIALTPDDLKSYWLRRTKSASPALGPRRRRR